MIYSIKLDELIKSFKYLKQVVFGLAERITNIEAYLSTLTERVTQGGVIVTGAFSMEKISPVDITELELIDIYNEVPQVLFKNSITVELTNDSFHFQRNDQPIFLERDKHGKYWVITTDKDTFWLVPSTNIRLNLYKLKTARLLFNFSSDSPSVDSNVRLINPARLSISPDGKRWKLEETGNLEFRTPNLLFELPAEIETKSSNLDTAAILLEKFHQLSQEYNQLFSQLEKSQEDYQQLDMKLQNILQEREALSLEIDLLKMRLEILEGYQLKQFKQK